MLKHLDFLHKSQVVIVWSHLRERKKEKKRHIVFNINISQWRGYLHWVSVDQIKHCDRFEQHRGLVYPEHNAVLDVQQDLLLLAVISNQSVQCVTVRNPTNQARVSGQGNHGIPLDTTHTHKQNWVMNAKALHILTYSQLTWLVNKGFIHYICEVVFTTWSASFQSGNHFS